MAESNGWKKTHTFLKDYITGLEDISKFHDFTPEHVSVVTFGHETKVLVSYHIEQCNNGANIQTRIIMITDGRVTEADLFAGPDTVNDFKVDEKKLADPFALMIDTFTHGLDHTLSEEEKEDMRNIQERGKRYIYEHATIVDRRNMYEEIQSSQLPEVGCRVRRGPDWQYRNQDSNGPGTVIGHKNDTQVWCEWDLNGYRNNYRYGSRGYSVLVVDEPRKLKSGEIIAVGCKVIPGKDWKNSDVHVETGVVIKIDKKNNSVLVRWNNGKRGEYSYAGDGKQEVKPVVDNRSDIGQKSQRKHFTSNEWEFPPALSLEEFESRKTKNKNKNKNKNIF